MSGFRRPHCNNLMLYFLPNIAYQSVLNMAGWGGLAMRIA